MIVIIEGPDGTGKTTLAERTADLIPGAVYLHAGPPENPPVIEYTRLDSTVDYVLDRWHLGELVYGAERGNPLSDRDLQTIEDHLHQLGAVVIHCTGLFSDVTEHILARGEPEPNYDKIAEHIEAFNAAVTRTTLPLLTSRIDDRLSPRTVVEFARVMESH